LDTIYSRSYAFSAQYYYRLTYYKIYATILLTMKSLISNLFRKLKNQVVDNSSAARSIADYNRELLVKQGRDQFMKLIDKGLTIPVNLV
jgi:hypothetical protein